MKYSYMPSKISKQKETKPILIKIPNPLKNSKKINLNLSKNETDLYGTIENNPEKKFDCSMSGMGWSSTGSYSLISIQRTVNDEPTKK